MSTYVTRPDRTLALQGGVAWDRPGLQKALREFSLLEDLPSANWPSVKRVNGYVDRDGIPVQFHWDQSDPYCHMMAWMTQEYASDVRLAHWIRFLQVRDFIAIGRDPLHEAGLLRLESGRTTIAPLLCEELAHTLYESCGFVVWKDAANRSRIQYYYRIPIALIPSIP